MATMAASAAPTPESLFPIAVLIDELKHDELSYRVNAMKRIDSIAAALGPERTRTELVPFLQESVDDDDEVLIALAEQLSAKFAPLVGGADFVHCMLPTLELLASVEESSVRDKAVISLASLIAMMPSADVAAHAWPVAQRLGAADWFVLRTSSCGLLAQLYARLRTAGSATAAGADSMAVEDDAAGSDAVSSGTGGVSSGRPRKEDAFALYAKLCGDDTPMVRRAASHALPDMGTALARGSLETAHALSQASVVGGTGATGMDDDGGAASLLTKRSGAGGTLSSASVAVAAASSSSLLVRDGLNVDTGDINSTAVPLPVPRAVAVCAASQESGISAAGALLPLVLGFARDEQDSVRLLSVDDAVALARLANGGMASVTDGTPEAEARLACARDLRDKIVSLVHQLALDASWRVRWSVANRLSELSEALGSEATQGRLLQAFEALMSDGEAEVRSAAAYRVADVGRLLGRLSVQVTVLPFLERLGEDPSDHVRAALASVVLGLAPVLGSEGTISSLLPLFLRLLKDGAPQVRLNLICKLEAVNAVIGLRVLSQSLLPAILELSADKQWRVRLAIIDFMPLLGAQLGADFFDSELTALCVRWLADSVAAIRDAASVNLRKLAEVFGPTWADRALMPRLLALHTSPEGESNYLLRQTALQAAVTVGEALGPALLASRVLPAVVAYARDPVPNVRFNVAKALERLAPKSDAQTITTVVRPVLQSLLNDPDSDVKYYATKALRSLG